MKFLLGIAWKNLSRSKLRTLISIVAIAVAVIAVNFGQSFINGMVNNVFSTQIKYNTGHVRIINEEYELQERLLSLDYPVNGFDGQGIQAMQEKLNTIEGVEQVIPRLKFGAIATEKEELIRMMGWGIVPEEEITYTNIDEKITEGRMVESGKREIVVGANLLEDLDHQVGEKITLVYNTSFGSFKGSTFKIVGKVDTSIEFLSDNVFYLPIDQAQEILDLPDQATEILLATPNFREIDNYFPKIKQTVQQADTLGQYLAIPWNKGSVLISLLEIALFFYNFFYIFIIFLASFVLINTMYMIIKERTREIGMMTALGLRHRDILYLFLIEGSIIGVVGSLLGAIIGGFSIKWLSQIGIDFSEGLSGFSGDMMMEPIIYPSYSFNYIIISFLMGAIVVAITCIIPARRASQLEPTEALRHI